MDDLLNTVFDTNMLKNLYSHKLYLKHHGEYFLIFLR